MSHWEFADYTPEAEAEEGMFGDSSERRKIRSFTLFKQKGGQ